MDGHRHSRHGSSDDEHNVNDNASHLNVKSCASVPNRIRAWRLHFCGSAHSLAEFRIYTWMTIGGPTVVRPPKVHRLSRGRIAMKFKNYLKLLVYRTVPLLSHRRCPPAASFREAGTDR